MVTDETGDDGGGGASVDTEMLAEMQSLTPHGSVSPSASDSSAPCGGAAAAASDNTIAA